MRSRVGTWVALGLLGGLMLQGTTALAAGWADTLFAERSHDFGPVARGAVVRHSFVLVNRLAEPVTIVDVRASCGCTTGWASASLVSPGQSATVEAQMDTRNFVGRKDTVLFVTLMTASGQQAEARLGVGSTILSDVVLNPGSLDFGVVSRGQTPTLLLTIDRVGNPDWRVSRMVSGCRAIDATLVETQRTTLGVGYRLTVSIKPDAPAGTFRDEIQIVTNDVQTPVIPVPIAGAVRGDLSASPSVLSLGTVASAAGGQGRFLVRSSRPFTIKNVEGAGDGFTVAVDDATAKTVHVLTVHFKPDQSRFRGDLTRAFRVTTDLPGESPVDVSVRLHVNP